MTSSSKNQITRKPKVPAVRNLIIPSNPMYLSLLHTSTKKYLAILLLLPGAGSPTPTRSSVFSSVTHGHEMQKYRHEMQKLCMWCTRVCLKNREIASGGTAHPYMYRAFFAHFEIRFIILNIFATSLWEPDLFLDMKHFERIQDRPKRPFRQDV